MWTLCLIVSQVLLALAIAVAVLQSARHKRRARSLYILIGGVAAAAVTMFFPLNAVLLPKTVGGIAQAAALSLFNTAQLFAAGAEFTVVSQGTAGLSVELARWHSIWASLLYVIAPCFTFGAVLSLFNNTMAHIRYALSARTRELYMFTEMNERSLTLAENLHAGDRRRALLFTNIPEDIDHRDYDCAERARAIGAIGFKQDVTSLNFLRHAADKTITFLAINDNENEALEQAIKLVERYKHRDRTNLFLFATGVESELLTASLDKGVMHVRRVNEVSALINRLLYDNGHTLFESAYSLPDGSKQIAAMVVGMGAHGTEMVKALAWFGQMDGYRLTVDAFDLDPLAEERFTAAAPELMSPRYNGVFVDGEAAYTIRIHAGVDVRSMTFVQQLEAIGDTTYVLVSLGSDELNIRTATDLRMRFERLGIHPVIYAVVQNTARKEALDGVCNFRTQPYDIRWIGDRKSCFSEQVILHSAADEQALARHLKWGKEEEFWAYEYNYRSSVASAIHAKARVACGVAGADKPENELTEQEALAIEQIEHRRWNAYMRAQGYVYSGSPDKATRNDLGKMHHDLVEYAALTDEEKRKDRVTANV